MAEGVPVLSVRMRENLFISDNGVDNIETGSQGSRDENITDRDPGFIEDRFRVDRKKLEQMLQLGKFSLPRTVVLLLSELSPLVDLISPFLSSCSVSMDTWLRFKILLTTLCSMKPGLML